MSNLTSILLVAEEQETLRPIAEVYEEQGCAVDCCAPGGAAARLGSGEAWSLVVVDQACVDALGERLRTGPAAQAVMLALRGEPEERHERLLGTVFHDYLRIDGDPQDLRRRCRLAIGHVQRLTERERVEHDLAAHRSLLEGVTRTLTSLLTAPDPLGAVDGALADLGRAANVDRVYITRHDHDEGTGSIRVTVLNEWHRPGLGSLRELGDAIVRDPVMREWYDRLERGMSIETSRPEAPPVLRERLERASFHSVLVVPVMADGACSGQIGFGDCSGDRSWTGDERRVLEATAAAIGSLLVRQRTLEAVAEQVGRVRTLYEAVANPTLPLEQQLQQGLAAGSRLLDMELGVVARITEEDESSCEVVHAYPPDAPHRPGDRMPFERATWDRSVAEDRPSVVLDAVGTGLWESAVDGEHGLRSFVGTPLWIGGRAWGGLAFFSPRPREAPFRETDLDLVRLIGRGVALMIEQLNAERERQELEERFRETQKLESLGLLAGGIAHDFNNLLMGIMGNASLATLDVPAGSRAHECLDQVTTASRRAADLTRQMLAYAGRASFRVEPVLLDGLVEEMSELLGTVVREDVRIERSFEPDLPPVIADPAQIQQVVMNLISNAAEALGGGAGVVRVSATFEDRGAVGPSGRYVAPGAPAGPYVVLTVTDEGVGMDEGTLARIFDPFFTTKAPGRGLGLAAVIGIVRSHRGALQVESAPGEGSTFRVLLPATHGPAVGNRPSAPPASRARLDARVLVVDDTPHVRETVRRILAWHGAEVHVACDGLDAVDQLREQPGFDAVVLDLTMPRMGGVEAHAALRRLSPGVPVLVMSGYSDDPAVAALLAEERTTFLAKPFRSDQLVQALRSAIER